MNRSHRRRESGTAALMAALSPSMREAVDQYLGLAGDRTSTSDRDVVVASGLALPARRAYEELEELVRVPEALTTIELLDRDDRV